MTAGWLPDGSGQLKNRKNYKKGKINCKKEKKRALGASEHLADSPVMLYLCSR